MLLVVELPAQYNAADSGGKPSTLRFPSECAAEVKASGTYLVAGYGLPLKFSTTFSCVVKHIERLRHALRHPKFERNPLISDATME